MCHEGSVNKVRGGGRVMVIFGSCWLPKVKYFYLLFYSVNTFRVFDDCMLSINFPNCPSMKYRMLENQSYLFKFLKLTAFVLIHLFYLDFDIT